MRSAARRFASQPAIRFALPPTLQAPAGARSTTAGAGELARRVLANTERVDRVEADPQREARHALGREQRCEPAGRGADQHYRQRVESAFRLEQPDEIHDRLRVAVMAGPIRQVGHRDQEAFAGERAGEDGVPPARPRESVRDHRETARRRVGQIQVDLGRVLGERHRPGFQPDLGSVHGGRGG